MAPRIRRVVRSKVFICHSPKDARVLEDLRVFLRPLAELGLIDFWDETQLEAGEDRAAGIDSRLAEAAVVVLLVTQDFFSDCNCEQELPHILEAEDRGELTLIPVFVRPSLVDQLEYSFGPATARHRVKLTKFKGFCTPERVLMQRDKTDREAIFVQLASKLKELTRTSPSNAARTVASDNARNDSPGVIFLADAADTLRQQRRRLARDLEPHGLEVVSNIPPPYDREEHDQLVAETLPRVDLSVHLLDAYAGREIDRADGKSYPQRQVELALKHAREQLIWLPPDLELESIDDPRHGSFLRRLARGERSEQTYEVISDARVDIARQIMDKLGELEKAGALSRVKEMAGSAPCLLVSHMKDTAHLVQVAHTLTAERIPFLFNQEANEPQTVIRLFEERVRSVVSLIVVYSEVSGEWVRERLDMAIKIAALEGRHLKLGVYAPDRPPEEASFSREPFRVRTLSTRDDALAFLGKAS